MYLDRLFRLMAEKQASDLFISCGAPINIKVNGVVTPISTQPMDVETVRRIAYELMSKEQAREFENELEMNLSHLDRAVGNFRINIFRQRGTISLVIRFVRSHIPSFEELRLPPVLLDIVMEKRGLVLIAGATGSGKSTTLAAMIDYRNSNKSGHILTIEDPIEYLFEHKQSIVNQRELNVDTQSYQKALHNALREAPDLIMIGEIRDRETMQQALLHTLTGHLCLSTLHANNSYHALSRIINMFPYDARSGLLSDLSIGLRAIVSQRLVRNSEGELQPAVEILLNTSLIAELIKNGEITQIKEAMEQSLYPGSQTFEQALSPPLHRRPDQLRRGDDRLRFADQPRLAHQPELADRTRRGSRGASGRWRCRSGRRAISPRCTSTPKCWIVPTEAKAPSRAAPLCYHWAHGCRRPIRRVFDRRSHARPRPRADRAAVDHARRRRLPGVDRRAARAARLSLRDAGRERCHESLGAARQRAVRSSASPATPMSCRPVRAKVGSRTRSRRPSATAGSTAAALPT